MADIGPDRRLKDHPQVILVDGDFEIDEELGLFVVGGSGKCHSNVNDSLYEGRQRDNFLHEQNLIVRGEKRAVIIGCGHAGIVDIMEKAARVAPQVCVGGYHLFDPLTRKTVDKGLSDEITEALMKYPQMQFYTCHCTGKKTFDYILRQDCRICIIFLVVIRFRLKNRGRRNGGF